MFSCPSRVASKPQRFPATMAEIIASAFGITTFGLQITKKVYELRELYKEIKSAPEDISTILTECEQLALVLDNCESQFKAVAGLLPSSAIVNIGFDPCKAALEKLDTVARDLSCSIKTSRIKGSIKVLLQRDELSKQKKSAQHSER